MSRHTINSFIGIVFFSIFLGYTSYSQEKLTSYLGEAEKTSVQNPVELNGKLYFILSEPDRKLGVYEYNPLDNTSELLFRESRVEGFSILRREVIYGRLLLFDANTIFEVDIENKRLTTIRKFDDFGWINHVYHNQDLLYIIGPPNAWSSQYQILIYNLHDDIIVDLIYDPKLRSALLSLQDRRGRIPNDEIILTNHDNRNGLYIYNMKSQSISVPNGAEDAFDKNLDGFVLHGDSTYLFYDRQKTVWSLNMNSRQASKILQVDSIQNVRAPYLTDNYIIVPAIEPHTDWTVDSYIYRKHLQTGNIDTFFFPTYSLRGFYGTDDHGAFAEVGSEFSYIDFVKETITPRHNYEKGQFSSYIGYDYSNQRVYFTVRTIDYQYALRTSALESDTSELLSFPISDKGIIPVYASDTLILFQNYNPERGTIVFSLIDEEIDEVLQIFSGFEGHEFYMHEVGSELYGSNQRALLFNVESAESLISFPGAGNPTSYKTTTASLNDHFYMLDNSERDIIWKIGSGGQSATRIELSHPDGIPISTSKLHVGNGGLYTQLWIGNRDHICKVNTESGVLDCLIDTSNFDQYRISGESIRLGDQLSFHLDTKEHGRELWAIAENIQDSYMVMEFDPDSSINYYASKIVRGDDLSIFLARPIPPHGIMRSDGTVDGTYYLEHYSVLSELLFYEDGYFYFTRNKFLNRSLGDVNTTEKLFYFDRGIYFTWHEGDIYYSGENFTFLKYTPGDSDPVLLADLENSFPESYFSASGHLFYTNYNGDYYSIHTTDGTPQNTGLLLDNVGRPYEQDNYFVVGDKLLFSHYSPETGSELWMSDGTTEGTDLFLDINPGASDSYPIILKDHGGYVYFSAEYEDEGRQLFRVDREEISLISSLVDIKSTPLEVFPNPAQEYLEIKAPDHGVFENVRILSADGKVVYQQQGLNSEQKINLKGVAPGIYFISAESNGIFFSGRFVKEH